MDHPLQFVWLAKATVTAVAGILLCAAVSPQATESDGEAAPTLIDYRNEPTARAVIVGTSLARRLKEEFFLPLHIRNLAVPGRSALTGLEIVASYPNLPANIFV